MTIKEGAKNVPDIFIGQQSLFYSKGDLSYCQNFKRLYSNNFKRVGTPVEPTFLQEFISARSSLMRVSMNSSLNCAPSHGVRIGRVFVINKL